MSHATRVGVVEGPYELVVRWAEKVLVMVMVFGWCARSVRRIEG